MPTTKGNGDICLKAANSPHILTDFINTKPFQKIDLQIQGF